MLDAGVVDVCRPPVALNTAAAVSGRPTPGLGQSTCQALPHGEIHDTKMEPPLRAAAPRPRGPRAIGSRPAGPARDLPPSRLTPVQPSRLTPVKEVIQEGGWSTMVLYGPPWKTATTMNMRCGPPKQATRGGGLRALSMTGRLRRTSSLSPSPSRSGESCPKSSAGRWR
jgi:hypothetical protein